MVDRLEVLGTLLTANGSTVAAANFRLRASVLQAGEATNSSDEAAGRKTQGLLQPRCPEGSVRLRRLGLERVSLAPDYVLGA